MTGRDRWISGVAGLLAALAGGVACIGAWVAVWATRGTR